LRSHSQNFDKNRLNPTRAAGRSGEAAKGFILAILFMGKVFLLVREKEMKIILWIIAIIFIVGLLTLTGVFKLIF
jgi:hypothetical protein